MPDRPIAELVISTYPDPIGLRFNPPGYTWYGQQLDFADIAEARAWLADVTALLDIEEAR